MVGIVGFARRGYGFNVKSGSPYSMTAGAADLMAGGAPDLMAAGSSALETAGVPDSEDVDREKSNGSGRGWSCGDSGSAGDHCDFIESLELFCGPGSRMLGAAVRSNLAPCTKIRFVADDAFYGDARVRGDGRAAAAWHRPMPGPHEVCVDECGVCAVTLCGCADDSDCDDGDSCTVGSCDVESGECVFGPLCPPEQTCLDGECLDAQEIVVRSGGTDGVCGGLDFSTEVTSPSAPAPEPARIAGGNTHGVCDCASDQWSGDPAMLPVTTLSNSDAWGEFVTSFHLPPDAVDSVMELMIRVDDGAEVYLNDVLVGTVDLIPVSGGPAVTHSLVIDDPALFFGGENTLRFYVVNTQNGHFGNPVGRGGPGDCMYVQYEAHVSYFGGDPDLIAWWRMEDRIGGMVPDASGHGHHLTINGSPTFQDNIVVFNDDGTLETPDSDELDLLGDWSVSYWVREDSNDHPPFSNPTNGWMSKIVAYADAGGGWFLNSSGPNGVNATFYGSPNCNHTTPDRLALGTWYRVTTTFDSATETLRIYFDDTLEYEASPFCSHGMGNNAFPVLLGGNIESNMVRRPYCKGAMADVRVYRRVLSPENVQDLYNDGV